MSIELLEPSDERGLRRAYEVTLADASRSYETPWSWQEYLTRARTEDPWHERLTVLAEDATGRVVASAAMELPLRDNTTMLWGSYAVVPGAESSDAAAELLTWFRGLARERGRENVLVEAEWPVDGEPSPKRQLLERVGYQLVLPYAHRVLDLPVDAAAIGSIGSEVTSHHREYDLIGWRDRCPVEWVDAYAQLRARMMADAPDGGIGFEAEDFDADRLRHQEREMAEQQRIVCTAVAVHRDGTLAGHSQVLLPATDPSNAFQGDTLVLRGHRGHRLGLALKARALLDAADELATRSLLHTWNAVENEPMIAVNERLGFRLVEYSGEFRCQV